MLIQHLSIAVGRFRERSPEEGSKALLNLESPVRSALGRGLGAMKLGARLFLLATIVFSPAVPPPALAESSWPDCAAKTADRIIAGCTKILAGGSKTPVRERVLAYVNRGIAFYDRGELDKSLADYTSAIRLDPKNA